MIVTAAVLRELGGPLIIEELDLDEPAPDEVLVRVVGVGMCQTDLMARRFNAARLPIVLGHEGAGIVEAVGAEVARVAPGDHVVMSFDSCGSCRSCRRADPANCEHFAARNFSGRRTDGSTPLHDATGGPVGARWFAQSSFATHALGTERSVVKVDPGLPLELLAPLGCGVQTGAASILVGLGATAGSTVAIFGVGSVGLSALLAARLAGAERIIAVDLKPQRLVLASRMGATDTFDGSDPDLPAAMRIACGGVDYALDTTTSPSVMSQALVCLASAGKLGVVGLGGELTLGAANFTGGRSISHLIEGGANPQTFIPFLIEQWQNGMFPFDQMITTYAFADLDRAMTDLSGGTTVKAVLRHADGPFIG